MKSVAQWLTGLKCEEVSICLYLRLPSLFIVLVAPVAVRVFPEPPAEGVEVEDPPEHLVLPLGVALPPVRRPQPTGLLPPVARRARRVIIPLLRRRETTLRQQVLTGLPVPLLRVRPLRRAPIRPEGIPQRMQPPVERLAVITVLITEVGRRPQNRALATEEPGPTQPRPMKTGPSVGKPIRGLEMGR